MIGITPKRRKRTTAASKTQPSQLDALIEGVIKGLDSRVETRIKETMGEPSSEGNGGFDSSLDMLVDAIIQRLTPKLDALIDEKLRKYGLSEKNDNEISAEEKERRRSIVISGVAESEKHTERERFQDDKQLVEKVLDALDVGCGAANVYRMGKPDNKHQGRLIKVVLPTSFFQSACLKNARKLRDFTEFGDIFIRPSLTKQQRKEEYELRAELRKRKKAGENVKINKGKIVSLN